MTYAIGWQPIQTAPKDGTPILAFCPQDYDAEEYGDIPHGEQAGHDVERRSKVCVISWERRIYGTDDDSGWAECNSPICNDPIGEPTRWLPIPDMHTSLMSESWCSFALYFGSDDCLVCAGDECQHKDLNQ
jgi:hypothetical protein